MLPTLLKLLKDGQLNKQAVAETITLMGSQGEQALINLSGSLQKSDTKLKVCIVRALALADIESPSIDFVIERLLKFAR